MSEPGMPLPLNLHEYEKAARAALPAAVYDLVAGGAGDEVTLRENRAAFGRWRLLPRVLRGCAEPDLRTRVLGQPISLPVLVAPMGTHQVVHPLGERGTAAAARRAGTIFTLATTASRSIEEIGAIAGPWWQQLLLFRDREITRDLAQRSEAAGARALVLTADTPVIGRREAPLRHGFTLPPGVRRANLPMAPEHGGSGAAGLEVYSSLGFDAAQSWNDVDWLASLTRLPLVLKGILAPDDARLALEHGARAVIVSNQGGRQLDPTVASLDALPAVAEAVNGRAEVLVDGGVRRGADVLIALALGARAVLVGRPCLWGLAVGGEEGALRVLELLRAELSLALTLSGRAGVAEVDRSLVVPVGPLPTRA